MFCKKKLFLANNQQYIICSTHGCIKWLEKLSTIIPLKNCESNICPSIIIYRQSTNNFKDSIKEIIGNSDLPLKNWDIINFRHSYLLKHKLVPFVIYDIGEDIKNNLEYKKMEYFLYTIYKDIITIGGIPVHAGLIQKKNKAVLIGGSSGAGKSTCCQRVLNYWESLCDDLSIINLNNNEYIAHPLPTWSNYYTYENPKFTWNVGLSFPLIAIFFIEQSNTDKILPVKKGEAAFIITRLAMQVYEKFLSCLDINEQYAERKKIFENAWEIASKVPCYILRCSLHGKFWEEIEKVI